MKIGQVAAQLYTLRDYLKTPSDIAISLKKVRAIGYEAVQVSGMGPIDEKELVSILDGEGLICCATHEPTAKILDNPEAVVERLNKLGCRYTALPAPAGTPLTTHEEVKSFASRINSAGIVLRNAGQVLSYHNHHYEFRRVEGRLILDIIYDQTDPKNLAGEIDTYWVQYGGGDPVAWCKKLAGRLPLLHLKDYAMDSESKPVFAEIGAGNLDWPALIAAAESSGCEWYIIEQDTCPGDPFDSLAQSFQYIREKLAAA
ncbi:MAG TPA: sugar phosphate isomerase/epimerase [Capsulimonadaceae bacterium]|nr:sugar phosphate isomerase/epimerase [Capsulimonadaceae bacterium]